MATSRSSEVLDAGESSATNSIADKTAQCWSSPRAAVSPGVPRIDTMEDRLSVCRSGRHSPRRLRGKSSR